ncbi:MAG: enhanced serine sensitivity protein SseB C-terminal domain-containing protein [Chloroflexi bacterium]|nr:enhanced serine sensitivity protein SseB C-terminal domain-containing protein [Chloroflexota bacterium]
MQIQPTPSNPELLSAMVTIAQKDSPENRRVLYDALINSQLLVPIAKPLHNPNKTGLQQVIGTTDVEFIVVTNKQDQTALLAFTDEPAVKAWKPEDSNYIASNGTDLFQMALEMNVAAIVLNVAGPTARGELMRWEIQSLASGIIPESGGQVGTSVITPPPDAEIKFAPLHTKPSEKFLTGLKDAFACFPEIAAGYLMQAQIGDAAPHLVAGVQPVGEMKEDEIHSLMNRLGDKVSGYLSHGEFIDFIFIEDETNVPVIPASDALVFKRE